MAPLFGVPMKARSPVEAFERHVYPEPNSGCWLWTGGTLVCGGYGMLYAAPLRVRAHRWSYEHFKGPIPEGLDVCHKCDTPCCVNPDHLFLGTRQDNMNDAKNKNRVAKGERHSQAVLTETQVKEIKSAIGSGAHGSELARQYGVAPMTISDIKKGRTWGHL